MNHNQNPGFTPLSKAALQELADRLLHEDGEAISMCVDFVCCETRGVWHGRARAMMCRRMKHVGLDKNQSAQLVDSIASRLARGQFSEQFKDQLRLAMTLDASRLFSVARACQSSNLPHVRAYAEWVLRHDGT